MKRCKTLEKFLSCFYNYWNKTGQREVKKQPEVGRSIIHTQIPPPAAARRIQSGNSQLLLKVNEGQKTSVICHHTTPCDKGTQNSQNSLDSASVQMRTLCISGFCEVWGSSNLCWVHPQSGWTLTHLGHFFFPGMMECSVLQVSS